MREIKFRAWDTIFERFVEVCGIDFSNGLPSVIHTKALPPEIELTKADLANRFILMQFTGLKDKNGKEIYEGDICIYKTGEKSGGVYSDEDSFTGVVRFCDGEFEIGNHNGYGGVWSSLSYLLGSYHNTVKDFKVIGNAYENPELLTPNA